MTKEEDRDGAPRGRSKGLRNEHAPLDDVNPEGGEKG